MHNQVHNYSFILNEQYQYSLILQLIDKQILVKDYIQNYSIMMICLFFFCLLGIYGKRSNSPTLTQFDFFHSFYENNEQHHLARRSLLENRTTQIYLTNFNNEQLTLLYSELLTTGLWYVTIINDGSAKEKFQLSIDYVDEKTERTCLNNCNNHGICQHGICLCYPSYTGADCSIGK